jgi:hypothetical protein
MTPEEGLIQHLNAGLAMLNGQKPQGPVSQAAMTPERLEDLRNGWQHNATAECVVEIDRLLAENRVLRNTEAAALAAREAPKP